MLIVTTVTIYWAPTDTAIATFIRISFNSLNSYWDRIYYTYFTDEEFEAQRG